MQKTHANTPDEITAVASRLKRVADNGSFRGKRHAREALFNIGGTIKRAYAYKEAMGELYSDMEWLMDNHVKIEQEVRYALKGLINYRYYSIARDGEGYEGCAVAICSRLICKDIPLPLNEERVEEGLLAFLKGFSLKHEEILRLFLMLRLTLTTELSGLCRRLDKLLDIKKRRSMGSAGIAWLTQEHRRLSGEIEHIILSLHFLSRFDPEETALRVSSLERILMADPAGVYGAMTKESRQYIRHMAALQGRSLGVGENEIATRALIRARTAQNVRNKNICRFIVEGEWEKKRRKKKASLYIFAMASLTVILTGLMIALSGAWYIWLFLLLTAWEGAKRLVDWCFSRTGTAVIPALDLKGSIPDEGKTMVVISALLTSPKGALELTRRMEEYYLANRDKNLSIALLADLKQGDKSIMEGDEELTRRAGDSIRELNAKYGHGAFCLFVRRRIYNHRCNAYMGWERKRGAICELLGLMRGKSTTFSVEICPHSSMGDYKYILALDADTRLGLGSARELIGAMLHPLNRPVIDLEKGRVTEGYAVMQPRMQTGLKSRMKSGFSRLFGGPAGTDTYQGGSFEVWQELFGEGIFCGKGILDIDTFLALASDRVEENTMLSHDIVEGSILRCAYVGGTVLRDTAPSGVLGWFSRDQRWIRGDWQNIVWLFDRVRDAGGIARKNPLSSLSKYKIFDNLRRSITPFSFLALFLCGAAEGSGFLWFFGILIFFLPFLLCCFSSLRCLFVRTVSPAPGGPLERGAEWLMSLALLPQSAAVGIWGAAIALWRLCVSKRNLLQWVTAAQADESKIKGPWGYYRALWACPVAGAGMLFFSARSQIAAVLGGLWLLAPWAAFFLSRPAKEMRTEPRPEDRLFIEECAGRIWHYFEDNVTEATCHLPPDNIQLSPPVPLARRTSPTNIGLYLLCAVAARDLGIMDGGAMLHRVEKTLDTIEDMEKWHGHLYNWYETDKGNVMHPRYVSTVDSGNFIACLIALKPALAEAKEGRALLERVEKIIDETDFGVLYNEQKRLFSIGYNDETGRTDTSCYDLLASEARTTSYIAIARGQVERAHWFSLGRPMSGKGGYRGLYSWTGTMFEYFMPALLMDSLKGSLLDESLSYCLKCQKERGAKGGIPWGISESAYFAFDSDLNYQYKAFGVQRLALSRNMNAQTVVSPYSSYLALGRDFCGAASNLRRLRDMGLFGRYGHFEAMDFTARREEGGGERVSCYMSHHLGMSLISIVNALHGNVMRRRFMADPAIASAAELLEEPAPRSARPARPVESNETPPPHSPRGGSHFELRSLPDPFLPRVALLGSSRHALALTDSGAGYSFSRERSITRRSLEVQSPCGFFVIARNSETGELISLTMAPLYQKDMEYHCAFSSHSALYSAKGRGIVASIEVAPGAGEGCEARKVTVRNTGEKRLHLELCAIFEPVLAPHGADEAHRAFSSLFVETIPAPHLGGVIFKRRARSPEEGNFYCCAAGGGIWERADLESQRDKIVKDGYRGIGSRFSNRGGYMTDTIAALKSTVTMEPGESATGFLALSASSDEGEATSMAACAASKQGFERYMTLSSERARAEDELLGLNGADKGWIFDIIADVLAPRRDAAAAAAISRSGLSVRSLWPHGISGDLPIIMADSGYSGWEEGAYLILSAHRLLFLRAVACDVVVTYEDADEGYLREGRRKIMELLSEMRMDHLVGQRGGVHLINLSKLREEERDILFAACDGRLGGQPRRDRTDKEEGNNPLSPLKPDRWRESKKPLMAPSVPLYGFCGVGGFNGNRYEVCGPTPRPFSMLLGNRSFGALVTAAGGGFTFALNSRENRISPWSNDSALDPPSELIELEAAGESISICAAGRASFGGGEARFAGELANIKYEMSDFVSPLFPIRLRRLSLENAGEGEEVVSVRFSVRLRCGAFNEKGWRRTVTCYDRERGMLHAKNSYAGQYERSVSFMVLDTPPDGYTCDFDDVLKGEYDTKKTGACYNPCFSMTKTLTLGGGERRELVLSLGHYQTTAQLDNIMPRLTLDGAAREHEAALKQAADITEGITIDTPDQELNLLFNGWLKVQTLICRIWCRTSFYQCSGAYGFRDQLQDAVSLLYTMPGVTRTQILRCAAHQFKEGDVQHWWHPVPEGKGMGHRGIRSSHSDSHLWLPWAVCEYIEATGDGSILELKIPYIEGDPLGPGERERYFVPKKGVERFSLYDHCVRALEAAMETGPRGLCLIKGGDWNDAMNLVGHKGKGESVWLTWFFSSALLRFSPLCRQHGEKERADTYEKKAKELTDAIEENAWDGRWYMRAFYDDGEVLGSQKSEACQIDSIAQSFSILSKTSKTPRARQAIESARAALFDEKHRLVRLFTPPFDNPKASPGYIAAYPPGVRENGGQYTHGAIWLASAFFKAEEGDRGYELLSAINPVTHGNGHEKMEEYRGEPYAVAADVYSVGDLVGRAGWSWYTGAAGWYYRTVIQDLLGIKKEGDTLSFSPCMPKKWNKCTVNFKYLETKYVIELENGGKILEMDQVEQSGNFIPLLNDKKIHVVRLLK